jgi:hypothetical protein
METHNSASEVTMRTVDSQISYLYIILLLSYDDVSTAEIM